MSKKRTDADLIVFHLRKGEEMPARLVDKFKRLSYIRDLLFGVGHMSTFQVAKQTAKFFGVPVSSTRLEVLEAKRLFPHLDPIERDFEKSWLIESIKRNISRAEEAGDFRAVASEHKNLDNLLGFSKDSDNSEAPVINLNILNYNPQQLEAKPMQTIDIDEKVKQMLEADNREDEEFEDINWEEE